MRKEMIEKGISFLNDNMEVIRAGEYIVGDQVEIVDSESESDEDVVNEFPILRQPVDTAD